MVPAKKKTRFKVGDRVRFPLGLSSMSGPVIEDFGNIGVGGEQLVYVQIQFEEAEPRPWAIGANDLTLVRRRRTKPVSRSRPRRVGRRSRTAA